MDDTIEHMIRERAYALWEKEGSPHGRDREFWERARMMVEASAEPAPATPLQQKSEEEVEEDTALAESFPASDPPSFTRAPRGRRAKAS
jgi:hypothetical protein